MYARALLSLKLSCNMQPTVDKALSHCIDSCDFCHNWVRHLKSATFPPSHNSTAPAAVHPVGQSTGQQQSANATDIQTPTHTHVYIKIDMQLLQLNCALVAVPLRVLCGKLTLFVVSAALRCAVAFSSLPLQSSYSLIHLWL